MFGGDVNFLMVLPMCSLMYVPTEAIVRNCFWSLVGYLCFITFTCLDCEKKEEGLCEYFFCVCMIVLQLVFYFRLELKKFMMAFSSTIDVHIECK